MKTSEIAELVGGTLDGEEVEVTGVAPLRDATATELSFLADARYLRYLGPSRAGAVLVSESLAERAGDVSCRIVVSNVHRALARVLDRLYTEPPPQPGVHPTAVIGRESRIGRDVTIGPHVVVGDGARVGDRVRIGAHAVLERGAKLDDDVVLHPHVTVHRGVRIGARSILHSGVRVGVDGFGYVEDDGAQRKIPQVGGCTIGADVEIGANSTVDRGSVGETWIGDGVKIDNLVHIGHNVRVGAGSIIVAQVGIAGSVTMGEGVTLAGQAGVAGHTQIGDGATIAARAGVFGDVPAGEVYSGYPARPHRTALRAQAALFRLPELMKRVRTLEGMIPRRREDPED